MSIDYLPSHGGETQVRKYRVPGLGGDWGKIRLSCGVVKRKNSNSENQDPKAEASCQVKVRPSWVRLEKCPSTSPVGLVWDTERKVNLEDKTVEIIFNGVVVRQGDADNVQVKTETGSEKNENYVKLGMSPDVKKRKLVAELHSCSKCGKMLKSMPAYRLHMLCHYQVFHEMLSNTKPYTCPICLKSFTRKGRQILHYALGHNKVFEFTDLTPESLKLTNNNKKNVECDEDGEFSCPKCGIKFLKSVKRSNIQNHILTHYHDVFYDLLPHKNPYSCPICDKTHIKRRNLIRHYAFAHKKVFQLTDSTPADWFMVRKEVKAKKQD